MGLEETNKAIREAAQQVEKWMKTLSYDDRIQYLKWRETRNREIAVHFFEHQGKMDDDLGTRLGIEYVIDRQIISSIEDNFDNFYKE